MNIAQETFGELDCIITDNLPTGGKPQWLVVLCHGFGATGEDLAGLGPELLRMQPELADKVRFYFPAAPLTPEEFRSYGGRAWWPLDLEALNEMMMRGEVRDLSNDVPEGLSEARAKLKHCLYEIQKRENLPNEKLIIGGFSQGAMITTDLSLRLTPPPAGLCIYSGTLLSQSLWQDLMQQTTPFPVLQSHGTIDPILPYFGAEALRDLLTKAGFNVEFLSFQGQHTIPLEALQMLAGFLQTTVTTGFSQ